jgi:hypothetical protein
LKNLLRRSGISISQYGLDCGVCRKIGYKFGRDACAPN